MKTDRERLTALFVVDEKKAIAECKSAMRHGSVADAALALGVPERTLYRWISLYPEIKKGRP